MKKAVLSVVLAVFAASALAYSDSSSRFSAGEPDKSQILLGYAGERDESTIQLGYAGEQDSSTVQLG